jgi:putative transposase
MARPLRIEFEGPAYHVASRGDAGRGIFLDDADRTAFLGTPGAVVARFGSLCHAYCLMSDHYHLLVETPTPNLSKGMQLLNDVYTQQLNRTAKRSGHVYRGRFKSILVNKDTYLLELARYVVLNPARANMVRSVRDWQWSSYRATAGQEALPSFFAVEWLLSRFSANPSEVVTLYRRFVQQDQEVDMGGASRWHPSGRQPFCPGADTATPRDREPKGDSQKPTTRCEAIA